RMNKTAAVVSFQRSVECLALTSVLIKRIVGIIDQISLNLKPPRLPPHIFAIGVIALWIFMYHCAPTRSTRASLDLKYNSSKRGLLHQHVSPRIREHRDLAHGLASNAAMRLSNSSMRLFKRSTVVSDVGGPGKGAVTRTAPEPDVLVVLPTPP